MYTVNLLIFALWQRKRRIWVHGKSLVYKMPSSCIVSNIAIPKVCPNELLLETGLSCEITVSHD